MTALGYIRVSTDEQVRDGVSLSAQAHKIHTYAELHDLNLIDIIRDEGFTGKNTSRPGLQSLLELVTTRAIGTVIVCKLDRLSRRTIDTLNLIETFKKADVAFHSIQEKVDTNTAMGQFFLTITAAFAQMERDLIAERTATALQHKRRNGEKTGGWTPYGYTRQLEDGTAILHRDNDEQRIIAQMCNWRRDGKSYRAIAQELNKLRIPTRAMTCNPDHPKTWSHKSVAKIIRSQEDNHGREKHLDKY